MFLITLGEPESINIECLQKILLSENDAFDFTLLIGSIEVFERQAVADLKTRVKVISFAEINSNLNTPGLYFLDCQTKDEATAGADALIACQNVIAQYSKHKIAILTSPVDKGNLAKSGFKFPGQTEFFEFVAQKKGLMCLAGERLKVGLVTNHLAIKDVPNLISEDLVYEKILALKTGLQRDFNIQNPRIFVAALNPHAGDNGLFGDEEQRAIVPAIKRARLVHQNIEGPLPADTIFYRAYNGEADAVLAMYHDQGLGPLKLAHFDTAINITMGLPFFRVSPDHGPAKDIAGQNKARITSFKMAFNAAKIYLKNSTEF